MGLFSKKAPASAAMTELPITAPTASASAATTVGSTAAPSSAASAELGAAAVPPARSAQSTPAAATQAPAQAKASRWTPHRAASDPAPGPAKLSLSATAASSSHHGDDDAAFEAKYAHLTPAERKKIKDLDALAHTLDSKFKIGPVSVGVESVIGLIPFAGDVFGAAMGTALVTQAIYLKMPKRLVARMMLNTGIDAALGMIPFVGDIFDFGHKANSKNVALLKSHMEHPHKATAADTCFLCGAFFCVVVLPCLIFLGVIAGIIILILWLCKAIFN
jgi:hypothetical protein